MSYTIPIHSHGSYGSILEETQLVDGKQGCRGWFFFLKASVCFFAKTGCWWCLARGAARFVEKRWLYNNHLWSWMNVSQTLKDSDWSLLRFISPWSGNRRQMFDFLSNNPWIFCQWPSHDSHERFPWKIISMGWISTLINKIWCYFPSWKVGSLAMFQTELRG